MPLVWKHPSPLPWSDLVPGSSFVQCFSCHSVDHRDALGNGNEAILDLLYSFHSRMHRSVSVHAQCHCCQEFNFRVERQRTCTGTQHEHVSDHASLHTLPRLFSSHSRD
mmetsp:Transcript_82859/g.268478  ORF Transcript_82859/g.268478 Transcript_82859/m.268478 type:complete len:109 (+) Transcript_82859:1663-1989(+)